MANPALNLVVIIIVTTLSFNAALIALYMFLAYQSTQPDMRRKGGRQATNTPPPALAQAGSQDWGLCVLFSDISLENNERLALLLATKGAEFDRAARTFSVVSKASQTPITVRHINAQKKMPSFQASSGDAPLEGVAVVIEKTPLAPSKLQLASVVKLAKDIARIGGTIVDADMQAIGQEGIQHVIAGKGVMR